MADEGLVPPLPIPTATSAPFWDALHEERIQPVLSKERILAMRRGEKERESRSDRGDRSEFRAREEEVE